MLCRIVLVTTLCGVAAGFAPVAPTFRTSSSVDGMQRRPPIALRMNVNNLEKIVVCTGPTCTRNGGGKKLLKIVDEMAAPLGVREIWTGVRYLTTCYLFDK